MQSQRDEAIVLHVRPYGDADAIVSLLTRLHGRVSIFSRGLRSARRKDGVPLTPTFEISLELTRKPGADLCNAKAISLHETHQRLSQDLLRLAGANVVLELCRELIEEGDGDEEAFVRLQSALLALETDDVWNVVLAFDRAILKAAGFGVPAIGEDKRLLFERHTRELERARGRELPARAFFLSVS